MRIKQGCKCGVGESVAELRSSCGRKIRLVCYFLLPTFPIDNKEIFQQGVTWLNKRQAIRKLSTSAEFRIRRENEVFLVSGCFGILNFIFLF